MPSTAIAVLETIPSRAPAPFAPPRRRALSTLGLGGWLGTMSPHTARAYASDLDQFRFWLSIHGRDFDDVTPGVITAWLSDLAGGSGSGTWAQFQAWKGSHGVALDDDDPGTKVAWLSDIARGNAPGTPLLAASQARKLSAVNSFYKFGRAEGETHIDPAPFKPPKVSRDDAVGSIGPEQSEALWAASEGKPRLRALIGVLMGSGLRVSEALGLFVADVQEQRGERVLRVMGKGSQPRSAVMPAQAVLAVSEWLDLRGRHDGPLFSTRTGKAMDARGAHREIRALGDKVGIAGLHPHTLRHTFATNSVESGAGLLKTMTALGHKSPGTTMRYIRGRDMIANSPVHLAAARSFGDRMTGPPMK